MLERPLNLGSAPYRFLVPGSICLAVGGFLIGFASIAEGSGRTAMYAVAGGLIVAGVVLYALAVRILRRRPRRG